MAKGAYDKTSPRIGFHNWSLSTIEEEASELLDKAFREALDLATDYAADATFQTDGRLGIKVGLPLGAHEYEDPSWIVSMDDMINEVVQLEDSEEYITEIRDELRRLASRLTDHLERK